MNVEDCFLLRKDTRRKFFLCIEFSHDTGSFLLTNYDNTRVKACDLIPQVVTQTLHRDHKWSEIINSSTVFYGKNFYPLFTYFGWFTDHVSKIWSASTVPLIRVSNLKVFTPGDEKVIVSWVYRFTLTGFMADFRPPISKLSQHELFFFLQTDRNT